MERISQVFRREMQPTGTPRRGREVAAAVAAAAEDGTRGGCTVVASIPEDHDGGNIQAQAERLPEYEHDEAPPSYGSETAAGQSLTYKLKQWDHGRQKFMTRSCASSGSSCSEAASFAISTRTKPRLFTSKPDIQMVVEGPPDGKPQMRQTDVHMACVNFDEGPSHLPWFPRATMKIVAANGTVQEIVEMESNDFVNWKMALDGVDHYWCLKEEPKHALVLKSLLTRLEVARWTYGELGTDASHGDYCGDLVIQSCGSEPTRLIIACGCYAVILYWKKMGRHYRNGVTRRQAAA